MQNSNIDLKRLLEGSSLSEDVAERLFGSLDVDIMKASALPEPASQAEGIATHHAAIERLILTAPDTLAMRNFFALYIGQIERARSCLEGLMRQESENGSVCEND